MRGERMGKREKNKNAAAGLFAWLLPVLLLAILALAAAILWEEHDPKAPAQETGTQETQNRKMEEGMEMQTEAETESETEQRPGSPEEAVEKKARELLEGMTAEEKAAQLFFITPEALTGVNPVTAAGDSTREAYENYPVGGIIYFEQNIVSEEQFREMVSGMKQISAARSKVPVFLGVDEEGGRVARLANHEALTVENTGPMLEIGRTKDAGGAREAGKAIGTYLRSFGLDVDFAPVADVLDSEENTVIGDRSFGTDPEVVSAMVSGEVEGLQAQGVSAVLKHFPGHGSTAEDTHTDAAYNWKSLEELEQSDFLPFRAGIEAGADFVMVGHLTAPGAAGEEIPSVFSRRVVTEVLRNQMEFGGIIITDAMNMDAIAANDTAGEAAVKALQAGVDMILMPFDFQEAYQAVVEAVETGTLSQERLDESVFRILRQKLKAGS